MDALSEALLEQRKATERLVKVVADTWAADGGHPRNVVEALELLRGQLHRHVDDFVDEEETQRPSAGPCFRARRYHELTVPAA